MSGIVAIINLDGRPVHRELLEGMTRYLSFRGPDGQDTWADGCVGFGHAMLRTTHESTIEHQPFTLNDDVWIVADARVDDRGDLKRRLEAEGHEDLSLATDVELILRAYDVWDLECMSHLIGDMVFAIWDKRRKRLFVADAE